jgi:hypothetical protein
MAFVSAPFRVGEWKQGRGFLKQKMLKMQFTVFRNDKLRQLLKNKNNNH